MEQRRTRATCPRPGPDTVPGSARWIREAETAPGSGGGLADRAEQPGTGGGAERARWVIGVGAREGRPGSPQGRRGQVSSKLAAPFCSWKYACYLFSTIAS